jgi:hypothetical protein
MSASEPTSIIQYIAVITGFPALAIEAGFLLLITALLLIFILVVLVILRIKKEMIKFNLGAGYIARMLTRGAEDLKIARGYYDFNEEEWRDGFDR